MKQQFIKIAPYLLNGILIVLMGYLAYVDYINIDYESGITYFELYVGYYSKFLFTILYLMLVVILRITWKKHSSLIHFLYIFSLGVTFILGWVYLNNGKYLALFVLIISVLLIYLNMKAIKPWWYLSKTARNIEKVIYLLSHNPLLRVNETHVNIIGLIKIKITRRRQEYFLGYLFIGLWLIGLLVFTVYPLFNSIYLSFTRSYYHIETGVTGTFIGFENYLNIFRNQTLMPKFSSYLGKMILSVPLIVIFALIIAMLINQPIKGKGIWRTIFFLPVIISSGPILSELTNQNATSLPSLTESEALNFIISNLGRWISDPLEALMTSLLLVLWYAGVPILIFLAGLQKTDSAIYEAASIDGASPWDRFWKITLPSIKPLISVAIIYIVVSMSLYVDANSVLVDARNHMLGDETWSYGYGYAAAISWIYFILMVVIMLIFVGVTAIRRKKVKRWGM